MTNSEHHHDVYDCDGCAALVTASIDKLIESIERGITQFRGYEEHDKSSDDAAQEPYVKSITRNRLAETQGIIRGLELAKGFARSHRH